MNERMISGEKYEALKQQLAASDAARIQAEQDRDVAYTRIGEQGARIAELEAALVDERTKTGDSAGLFAGDRMRFTTELLQDLVAQPNHQTQIVEVDSITPVADGTKAVALRADRAALDAARELASSSVDAAPDQGQAADTSDATSTVTEGGQQGEGGSDLGAPRR